MEEANINGLNEYLKNCPEITRFCSQNGWIDNTTLRTDIIERHADEAVVAVYFDEIVMEGAGCVAGTVPCYGRVRVKLDRQGAFAALEVV